MLKGRRLSKTCIVNPRPTPLLTLLHQYLMSLIVALVLVSAKKLELHSEVWPRVVGSRCFCVTHLPQVAAFADKHFQISKDLSEYSGTYETNDDVHRVTIVVRELVNEEARITEISNMLGIGETEGRDLRRNAGEKLKYLNVSRKLALYLYYLSIVYDDESTAERMKRTLSLFTTSISGANNLMYRSK